MSNMFRAAGGAWKEREFTPREYVLLMIPRTASTWLDEVTWRLELKESGRRGYSPRRINVLRFRSSRMRCIEDPLPVSARRRFMRFVRKKSGRPPPPGSSFYERALQEKMMVGKHDPWVELPEWMRAYPVVAVLRDVLPWHLSRWLHVRQENPGMSLREYWDSFQPAVARKTLERALGIRLGWSGIGFYTVRTLMLIHRDPHSVFRRTEAELDEYFEGGRWRGDICRGWFLRQERLMEDLHRVLVREIGYRREDLERVLADLPERLNAADPGQRECVGQELYGNEALCREILHAERFVHRYLLPGLTGRARDETPAG